MKSSQYSLAILVVLAALLGIYFGSSKFLVGNSSAGQSAALSAAQEASDPANNNFSSKRLAAPVKRDVETDSLASTEDNNNSANKLVGEILSPPEQLALDKWRLEAGLDVEQLQIYAKYGFETLAALADQQDIYALDALASWDKGTKLGFQAAIDAMVLGSFQAIHTTGDTVRYCMNAFSEGRMTLKEIADLYTIKGDFNAENAQETLVQIAASWYFMAALEGDYEDAMIHVRSIERELQFRFDDNDWRYIVEMAQQKQELIKNIRAYRGLDEPDTMPPKAYDKFGRYTPEYTRYLDVLKLTGLSEAEYK